MKRALTVLGIVFVVVAVVGCATAPETRVSPDTEITMENIDDYLIADDVRFIDFRNYDDAMRAGYIAGFEIVPFFDYLEGRALVRNDEWNFSPDDIIDEAKLERLFGPKDQTIVGICRLGIRSAYVFEALEYLGWTNLINAGGFDDYEGANLIAGDGTWQGAKAVPADGVTMDNIDDFMDRPGAKYVDFRNIEQQYTDGYIDGFTVISFFEFLEDRAVERHDDWNFRAENVIDEFMLEDIFGDKDRELFLMCQSGARSGYIKEALESIGYTKVYNVGGIQDYTGDRMIYGDPSFEL